MAVVITPEMEQRIKTILKSGHHKSEAAVLEEALRLMERREQFRAEMLQAIAEADRGELLDEEEFFRDLEAQVEQFTTKAP
jgi:Arc/MetJ-type ribon-helix-helix transcriptional regulator